MSEPAGPPTSERPLRRDAARNRECILAAAAEVFAADGLGASVEEVARVAGVGMGTLYRRFPTKEGLVNELVRATLVQVVGLSVEASQRADGRGLEVFLHEVCLLQDASRGCLPRLWSSPAEQALVRAARTGIAALLADAQRQGRIRVDVTATDVTVLLWSLRGVIESSAGHRPAPWQRHLELSLAGWRPAAQMLVEPALGLADLDQMLVRDLGR